MKIQQLRYLAEVARRELSVSAAAEALHTSQPGVSRQIKELEDELGVTIFVRHGKRLTGVTEPGRAVLGIAERILAETANLKRAGAEFANEGAGTLTVATTHTQARYYLPRAVAAFKRRYPRVHLVIHQGNPTQICAQVAAGEADLCVATEAIDEHAALVSLPCYQWNRCVVVPPRHPLLKARPLTLEELRQEFDKAVREDPTKVTFTKRSGSRPLRRRARVRSVHPATTWARPGASAVTVPPAVTSIHTPSVFSTRSSICRRILSRKRMRLSCRM